MKPSILDSREKIAKRDTENLLGSIEALPDQIEITWSKAASAKLPVAYKQTKRIVVCGMGGSTLPPDVVLSTFLNRVACPLVIVRDYHLPAWVDKDTLVIACSYSGNTEETLSATNEAAARKAKVVVITGGGQLLELAKSNRWPTRLLTQEGNPSNQPRMAIGSFTFTLIEILRTHGSLHIEAEEVHNLAEFLREQMKQFTPEVKDNPAKQIAEAAKEGFPLFISAQHLTGSVHVMTNQFNENAKHIAFRLEVPEMNHHFLEALSFPTKAKASLSAILFQSQYYNSQTQKRIQLTAELLLKNGIPTQIVNSDAASPLEQAWETLCLGSFASFYLAMLHKIDPAPVPNVESFKKALANKLPTK